MADIVERLRGDLDMLSSPQMHALAEEAALEIERLRYQVDALLDALRDFEKEERADG